MEVTLKTKIFDFFEKMKLWLCNKFLVYWFSSKCFYFSDNFFKNEVTHLFDLSLTDKWK